MPATPAQLFSMLDQLGVVVTTTDHAPVFTVEESRALRGQISGAHTKNLFLRDNKRNFFLVCLDEQVAIDLKRLRPLIGAKGGLSFGSPEALMEHLGVQPGSVSLFALLNDREGRVTAVIDDSLLSAATVNCHPLTNEQTTSIAPDRLMTFLRATGHEPLLLSAEAVAQAE